MQCVKCEEGELKKIKFNKTGRIAHVCDFCRTFWFDGEQIRYDTGHSLDPFNQGDDYENAALEINETDQDHQAVKEVRII
ncbi:MAG TPA: hypothetical protein VND99_01635 [Candidatus Acidoferrales bacterium]|nr:hypothetical protein [Candidatus Acidoferrales bacterium]